MGVGLLFFTWQDYHREETDINVFGFMLDFSRDDYPLMYRAAMLFHGIGGIGLIIYGLTHIGSWTFHRNFR